MNKKGFVSIIAVLVLGVVVVAAGIFYYAQRGSIKSSEKSIVGAVGENKESESLSTNQLPTAQSGKIITTSSSKTVAITNTDLRTKTVISQAGNGTEKTNPGIIMSPQTGNRWELATAHTITWKSIPVKDTYSLLLWLSGGEGGGDIAILEGAQISKGSYTWDTLSVTQGDIRGVRITPGTYRVGADLYDGDHSFCSACPYNPNAKSTPLELISSSTSGMFEITGVQPFITIRHPANDEVWKIGDRKKISWDASKFEGEVKITIGSFTPQEGSSCKKSYCGSGPLEYFTLGTVPNTGAYEWKVGKAADGADIPPHRYWMEITSADAAGYMRGITDETFVISP